MATVSEKKERALKRYELKDLKKELEVCKKVETQFAWIRNHIIRIGKSDPLFVNNDIEKVETALDIIIRELKFLERLAELNEKMIHKFLRRLRAKDAVIEDLALQKQIDRDCIRIIDMLNKAELNLHSIVRNPKKAAVEVRGKWEYRYPWSLVLQRSSLFRICHPLRMHFRDEIKGLEKEILLLETELDTK